MSINPVSGVICTGVPLTDEQRVKIRSAQRKLDEAEKLDPSNYQVYMLKAGSYLLIGNFNDALKLGEKSVQLEEKNSKVNSEEKDGDGRPLSLLGGVYLELGHLKEAEENYQSAIQKNLNDPILYKNLGEFYWELDRKKEAINEFKKAKKLAKEQGTPIDTPDDKKPSTISCPEKQS